MATKKPDFNSYRYKPVDNKQGMLLWQSKLQENIRQENEYIAKPTSLKYTNNVDGATNQGRIQALSDDRDKTIFLPKIQQNGNISSSVSCDNLSQIIGNGSLIYGLGGAGAPKRSPSGKVVTFIQGHPEIRYHQKDTQGFDQMLRYQGDKNRTQQYKQDLDRQVEEQRKWKEKLGAPGLIKIMSNAMNPTEEDHHGVELASILQTRKYKSLPRLNLSSTDVTRPFVTSPRGHEAYYHEPMAEALSSQLEEKARMMRLTQQSEEKAAAQHFNTWDSFWGRPGHGAPIFLSRSKSSASIPLSNVPVTHKGDLFKKLHPQKIQVRSRYPIKY